MAKIPIINAKGSTKNDAEIIDLGYDSVLNYWEKEKECSAVEVVKTCPCCGEKFENSGDHMAVGGHVLIVIKTENDELIKEVDKWFIMPICTSCNNLKKDEPFVVDHNLLVEAPGKPDQNENMPIEITGRVKDNFISSQLFVSCWGAGECDKKSI